MSVLDPPLIMSKDGEVVTVRSSSDYVRFKYEGWVVTGDGEPIPEAPVSVKTVNGKPGPTVTLEIADIADLEDALASAGLDEAAVTEVVSGLLTGAPAAYDTLLEIANAMASDDTAAAALIVTVAGKLNTSDLPAKQRELLADGLTYNSDGTIATSTEGGIVTTYTWNADGTIHTEARLGKTKTYTYDGTSRLTGSTVV